jgi:hypothetical protein
MRQASAGAADLLILPVNDWKAIRALSDAPVTFGALALAAARM